MVQQTIDSQRDLILQREDRELQRRETFTSLIEELKSEFQEIDNLKIAQQITLIDFANFCKIKPRECLNKNWLNEARKHNLAPNICEMIETLNRMFKWTQITILLAVDIQKRGRLIKKFIKICRCLMNLNNFHSLSAVFGALRSTPIWKLKKAWNLVPKKHLDFYQDLVTLFDTKRNMQNLRKAHHEATVPKVPYTGIFLTELVGIEEGNKDSTERKAINFAKLVMISDSIKRVLVLQTYGYDKIEEDVPLTHFLHNQIYDDIHRMGHVDEDYLYDFSKATAQKDEEDSVELTLFGQFRDASNSISRLFRMKQKQE